MITKGSLNIPPTPRCESCIKTFGKRLALPAMYKTPSVLIPGRFRLLCTEHATEIYDRGGKIEALKR